MEIIRPIELIQIADNEYRLSGCFAYMSNKREWIEYNGNTFHRDYTVPEKFDIDESWENEKHQIKEKKYGASEDTYLSTDNWYCHEIDFMKLFDLPILKIWEPVGWNRSFFKYLYPFQGSENEYVLMLQALNYLGLFKKIKGHFNNGKSRDYFDPDIFTISIDGYGFNNSIWFDFEFKNLIQYDLLKLVERLQFYYPEYDTKHGKLINKIIKDYYTKTGSINDTDRVNILSNYINAMSVHQ